MCEWLSCGEWCDVQLLCGGRSFSAHRVVLASVSTFLRRILLSSSSDETTTCIVLPDFDIEAMYSVLYYIYNGEVVLQKNKLGLFLDIIQAMQIYIDSQYLPKIQEGFGNKCFKLEKYSETIPLSTKIFTLGFDSDENQDIFNIKKGKELLGAHFKCLQSHSDFDDNNVRCKNKTERGESRQGNLKSPYENRQRHFLLRDLFIETYPPNGNVNGLPESVLAISNDCYHSPASVLLANANCQHLSSDDARTRDSKTAPSNSLHSSTVVDEDGQHAHNYNKECSKVLTGDTADSLRHKYSANIRNPALVYGKSETYLDVNKFIPINRHKISSGERKIHVSFDVNKFVSSPTEFQVNKNTHDLLIDSAKQDDARKNNDIHFKTSTRVIFNHVLESPWNARKPNNYRPFRRREKVEAILPTDEDNKKESKNDTNNNIQNSPLYPEAIGRVAIEEQDLIDGYSIVEHKESSKCTHCDQVFTSGELLAVHMRRHLTNARYTCGECGKTFSQLRNFKYHMSIHRGTREFAATCTVCGKYFNDRGYLSSHMKIHRNRKEYKCSLCPKSFNQRVAYNMHVRIHTGVKPHVCEECGKAFSRKMLLKQHQRTHSGERPYACTHCDKRFADRSNMTLHLRLHTGVKPFSCPMCPKSFTKKHHLKSHLNFHTGSKPYSCPRCGLAFTQSSNMRTHYKKCTAPEPSTSNDSLNNVPI